MNEAAKVRNEKRRSSRMGSTFVDADYVPNPSFSKRKSYEQNEIALTETENAYTTDTQRARDAAHEDQGYDDILHSYGYGQEISPENVNAQSKQKRESVYLHKKTPSQSTRNKVSNIDTPIQAEKNLARNANNYEYGTYTDAPLKTKDRETIVTSKYTTPPSGERTGSVYSPERTPTNFHESVGNVVDSKAESKKALKHHRTWRGLNNIQAALLGLGVSILSAMLIAEIVKVFVAKPRPNFIANCVINVPEVNRFNGFTGDSVFNPNLIKNPNIGMFNTDICVNKNSSDVNDAYKSFPSQTAAIAFASLFYLALYLAGHMAAIIISVTGVKDYSHFLSDVVGGAILGILTAYVAYRLFYPRLTNRHSRDSYDIRFSKTDQTNINGYAEGYEQFTPTSHGNYTSYGVDNGYDRTPIDRPFYNRRSTVNDNYFKSHRTTHGGVNIRPDINSPNYKYRNTYAHTHTVDFN
ncbi:Lipid phosphate phosphatase 1 [Zancudomyces culisetae]|uniref:Lipid phosphate phosphatase 1 n=1 Tax=Zancudomyces culisetae TaxID=1213189 RepID=A0A1R1PLC1_ZANCU|nr:Lipid phosphate phosphatase 1 [Zancudomyces culisetae]|eukprot:OMH81770.1 Lipid phosphate phosphatase 1 [Zancudomyces culisetae]